MKKIILKEDILKEGYQKAFNKLTFSLEPILF